MPPFRDRSTGDIIIIVLTIGVAATVILSMVLLIVVEIVEPEEDLSGPAGTIGTTVSALVSAIIGYLAGSRRRKDD